MSQSADKQRVRSEPPRSSLRRMIPLGLLALAIVALFASGLHRQLSFDRIAMHYGTLAGLIGDRPLLSALVAMLAYALATAVSFPAAWLLTVSTGLLFGWMAGGVIVVLGATSGACILYLAARYALADFFRARAGNVLNRMADGFRSDATSYMLFLRLAPVFPFTLVNVVPAILGVPFITFVWTTFVGIIPGVMAYVFAGVGLRSIVAERAEACRAGIAPCGETLGPGDLITPQILIAFAALGVVSLIPVVLKRMRRAA